jgi:hypothetical protein
MSLKTFRRYCLDKEIDLTPDQPATPDRPAFYTGRWFEEKKLPMILSCTCCDMTMCAFSDSILIDEDGYVFCRGCADPDQEVLQ